MKLLTALLSLLLFHSSSFTILVVDRDLKKPLSQTNNFTPELYMQRNFPIYSSDLDAVVTATEQVAKKIEQGINCNEKLTIRANHTSIVLITPYCDVPKTITVRFITHIEESDTDFIFDLIKQGDNKREMQRRLLDFTTYLMK